MGITAQIRSAAAALLLVVACLPTRAETVQTTQYSAYTVSGRTPIEIYRSILNRGPTVDGNRAIAATTAQAMQSHVMQQDVSSCRVTQFQLSFRFDVKLPRLVNSSALSPQDRYLWQQFTLFLKAHELQHTRLWLRCGKQLEQRVMALRAPTCEELQRRADATWKRMSPGCDKLQSNFDKQQRGELMSQPFMQRVVRGE